MTVFYDPHHPSTLTIDQEDNQSSLSVELTIVLLVLGIGCTGVAIGAGGLRLLRRVPPAPPTSRRANQPLLGRHARTSNSASEVLGWGSWPLLLIGLAGVVISVVFLVQEAQGHAVTTAHAIGDSGGFGAVAAFLFVLATSRVSGSSDGTLHLINPAFEVQIPVGLIRHARADGGLQIVTEDGRSFRSSAFGGSVLGYFLGNQRSHRVLARYDDWRSALPPASEYPPIVTVSRRLRPAIWTAPAWILG